MQILPPAMVQAHSSKPSWASAVTPATDQAPIEQTNEFIFQLEQRRLKDRPIMSGPMLISFRLTITMLFMSIAIFAFGSPLLAQDRTWTNTLGGGFNVASNWDSSVPTASENAILELNANYGVDLTADATIFSLQQYAGEITFSGGHTLTPLIFRISIMEQ